MVLAEGAPFCTPECTEEVGDSDLVVVGITDNLLSAVVSSPAGGGASPANDCRTLASAEVTPAGVRLFRPFALGMNSGQLMLLLVIILEMNPAKSHLPNGK